MSTSASASISVPSDILESERSLYIQGIENTLSQISAKQSVFERRFPGIGWAEQTKPFPARSFSSFVSVSASASASASSTDTSSPVAKKNTYSQHASSAYGARAKKDAAYHTSAKNTPLPRSSTSTSSSLLFRTPTAVPQHSSSKKPTTVSTKNTGGWMGSTSTR